MTLDRGIVAALGAAALFGLSTPIAKTLVGEISPLLLAGLLYAGSGVGLSIVLTARAIALGHASIVRPRGADLLWLLGAIAFGGAIGPYLLMFGLQMTDSASASLILNLEGVFTALLAWFAFKENFDRRIAAGMALIVAGGVVLSMGSALRASGIVGPLAIAGACLAWAIDNNLTRKVSINDAMLVACIKGLIAGPISVALALRYGAHLPAVTLLLRAGLLGFVGYGLSLTLFVLALRNLGTARTGAYRRCPGSGLGCAIDPNPDSRRTIHGGRCVAALHGKPRAPASSFARGTRTLAYPRFASPALPSR